MGLLICLFAAANSSATRGQDKQADPPIIKEALIRQLQLRPQGFTVAGLIQRIEQRKVAFRLTGEDEQEIRAAGSYLPKNELDRLIAVVRANFLPSSNIPLRITYFFLEDNAVDFFLRGQISQRLDAETGDSFVIKNNTFRTLSYLVRTFSEPKDRYELSFFTVKAGEKTYYDERLANLYVRNHRSLFVGGKHNVASGSTMEGDLTAMVSSLNDPVRPWRVFWWYRYEFPKEAEARERLPTWFFFQRFADRSDLKGFGGTPLGNFYLYITRKYMPPDFGYLDLTLDARDEGCGAHASAPRSDYHFFTLGRFHGPFLTLRIALIENISKEPVRLGNFILKENDSDSLRPREEDQALLSAQPPRRQDLFPIRILKPGEKIAVPVEILISRRDEEAEREESPPVPDEAIKDLKRIGGVTFSRQSEGGGPTTQIKVKGEVIEDIANRPKIDFTSAKDYVYGPSVGLEGVEIDKRDYLVRKGDLRSLLITAQGTEGSCPYVYTYSESLKSWRSQGVILGGVNQKVKEATDEKPLREFDGRILIKERDPEESFIDSVFVRAISPDGRETILYPENEKLRFSDGDYLRLRQGEEVVVNFVIPERLAASKYVLSAKGYYVPYAQPPARPRQAIRRR